MVFDWVCWHMLKKGVKGKCKSCLFVADIGPRKRKEEEREPENSWIAHRLSSPCSRPRLKRVRPSTQAKVAMELCTRSDSI
eukprot:SAG11_NODE_1228_length_5473_cov_3.015445_4_plen_81_part_00